MVYPISCILPHGRTLYFDENLLKVYSEKPKNQLYLLANNCNDENSISFSEVEDTIERADKEELSSAVDHVYEVYDKDSHLHMLSLSDIGDFFHFTYVSHLVFLHESDLRNYHSWSLDSICIPGEICNVDDAQRLNPDTEELVGERAINLDKISRLEDCDLEAKIARGGLHENLFVKYVTRDGNTEVGYGLFTSKCILVGKMIGEYVGILLSNTQEPSTYSMYYPSSDGDREINASQYGNLIRFVNHSSDPNCCFTHVLHDGIMHIICVSFPLIDLVRKNASILVCTYLVLHDLFLTL